MTKTYIEADELVRVGSITVYQTGVVLLDRTMVCNLVILPAAGACLPPIRSLPNWVPRTLKITCVTADGGLAGCTLKRGVMGGDSHYVSAHFSATVHNAAEFHSWSVEAPEWEAPGDG